MPILCSKSTKIGVPEAKKAQKPRFCARKAGKWGFRRQKKHKNLNFVLEKHENGGLGGKKSTKTSILCSKCPKTGVPDPKSAQKCRFCARGWLPRAQQRCHEPCGVHLAAVRQATDCRNLPRNLPSCMPPPGTAPCMLPGTAPVRPTAVCYRRHACRHATCRRACYREQAARLPAAAHAAVALPPRRYRKKLPSCAPPRNYRRACRRHTTARWVPRPAGG